MGSLFSEKFLGFDVETELKPAFDKVANPLDWRAPISALVEAKDLAKTIAAIGFHCGTSTEVLAVGTENHTESLETIYRVKSVGYRNGPCGP